MSRGELVDALVNLGGALRPLEQRLVREAGARVGQPPLSASSAAVLAELHRRRSATLRQLAAGLEVTTAVVRTAIADLERRDLATSGGTGPQVGPQAYRPTRAAEEFTQEARRRAAHHFGYALASISAEDLTALERAAPALQALAAAIGFEAETGLLA